MRAWGGLGRCFQRRGAEAPRKTAQNGSFDAGRRILFFEVWRAPRKFGVGGLLLLLAAGLHAETGYNAWLRYAPVAGLNVPAVVTVLDDSALAASAQAELIRGLRGMTGRILRAEHGIPKEPAIVLGTLEEIRQADPQWKLEGKIGAEGFWLKSAAGNVVVAGADERGILYGAFALLRTAATGEALDKLDDHDAPATSVRWVNQWDNLDGSIERGYGGRSIFWDGLHARADFSRVSDYGHMLASLGINACSINNVNANPRALAPEFLPEIARIADAFRPWGVRVVLAIDFGSPKTIGGLDTFDPVDPRVAAWWKA